MENEGRDIVYLEHIRERTDRINEIAQRGRGVFNESHVLQDAVIRNLEVIGEAVKQISPGLLDAYPQVRWKQVAGLRDVLIHNYMGVDLDRVWNVVANDLPNLKRTVGRMLSDIAP